MINTLLMLCMPKEIRRGIYVYTVLLSHSRFNLHIRILPCAKTIFQDLITLLCCLYNLNLLLLYLSQGGYVFGKDNLKSSARIWVKWSIVVFSRGQMIILVVIQTAPSGI